MSSKVEGSNEASRRKTDANSKDDQQSNESTENKEEKKDDQQKDDKDSDKKLGKETTLCMKIRGGPVGKCIGNIDKCVRTLFGNRVADNLGAFFYYLAYKPNPFI